MTDAPVKVCHVVNAVGPTSVPADIATAQAANTCIEPGILSWFDAQKFEGDNDVDVNCLNAPRSTFGIDASTFRDAKRIISNYDIIQTHHNHSGSYVKPVAVLLDKIVISTEQNNHGGFTTKGLMANAATNPLADAITCVSESVLNSFRWWERILIPDENLHVIYNGVDLNRIERSRDLNWSVDQAVDISSDAFVIGNAAMFTEQKAQDVLIRAVGAARRRGYNVELVIAGDGKLQPYLDDIVKEEGLKDVVHFLGLLDRPKVYRLMSTVDIYAMPSRWEGFSAAAIEALAIGTPCLFSNIDEFTKPFANVAAFHRVDNVDDLTNQIEELYQDEVWRKKLGEKGKELATQFSTEAIAEQYHDIYRDLITG